MPEFLATINYLCSSGLGAVWAVLAARRHRSCGCREGGRPEAPARTRTWLGIVAPVSLALIAGPTHRLLFAIASSGAPRIFCRSSRAPVDRGAILIAYAAIAGPVLVRRRSLVRHVPNLHPVYVGAVIRRRLVLFRARRGASSARTHTPMGLFPHRLQHQSRPISLSDMGLPLPAGGRGLLLFVLVVVQFNDVAQFSGASSLAATR